jgi:hypothetical protein
MGWLGDQYWTGVSGVAAVVTLLLLFYDRKKEGGLLRTFFKMAGFFVLGAAYAPVLMVAAGTIGQLLNALGFGPLEGAIGRAGLVLSGIEVGYWGFNPALSVLERQLSALGLWVGGTVFGMLGVMIGLTIDLDFDRLNKWFLVVPFYSVVFAALIGIINGVAWSQ